jgi:hypothetical protein
MFLKFLDDMEQIRVQESRLAGKKFRPASEPPYRWRDWAAKPEGITGPELISFVNHDEAVRPDGKRGPGLFGYLRSLQGANGGDRRDVVATVFNQFQASQTNAVSASTNLTDWLSLGLRVSDTNGLFQIEEVDPMHLPIRFYRVQSPPGP